MRYRIRVQGHLDPSWQHRFEGWRTEQQNGGTSLLSLETSETSGGEETAERP